MKLSYWMQMSTCLKLIKAVLAQQGTAEQSQFLQMIIELVNQDKLTNPKIIKETTPKLRIVPNDDSNTSTKRT